jgi:hypothetical protein
LRAARAGIWEDTCPSTRRSFSDQQMHILDRFKKTPGNASLENAKKMPACQRKNNAFLTNFWHYILRTCPNPKLVYSRHAPTDRNFIFSVPIASYRSIPPAFLPPSPAVAAATALPAAAQLTAAAAPPPMAALTAGVAAAASAAVAPDALSGSPLDSCWVLPFMPACYGYYVALFPAISPHF